MANSFNAAAPLKVLFSTKGRMSRSRYWLMAIPLWAVYWMIHIAITETLGSNFIWPITLMFFYMAYCLSAKRLHDHDKSSYWLLIILIPIIGPIWALIDLGFRKGTDEDNRYGPNPLVDGYDYLTVK